MRNDSVINDGEGAENASFPNAVLRNGNGSLLSADQLPEVLFISSYPPRECGIATYSQDLLKALNNKFSDSFSLRVCALESENIELAYPEEVKFVLDTNDPQQYAVIADAINKDPRIRVVLMQHEFGFFQGRGEEAFAQFLHAIHKPVVIVFHTVLPHPDETLKAKLRHIIEACSSVVVMTKSSAKILQDEYGMAPEKMVVIEHGTHLVPHLNREFLKEKYGLAGRKVLTTFGLLGPGKGIATTLDSLPAIIEANPDVVFLVIGKTHPGVVKSEGEKYRDMLEAKVGALNLSLHVEFINRYLPLEDLLEYLQLTDIYLFTSNDPNQAVSGTFSYAMSCGCPIISTPIPHAKEVLREDTGIIIDFQNSQQLTDGVNRLMSDEPLRMAFESSTLQRMAPTAWENSAIAHAQLLRRKAREEIVLQYRLPQTKLDHLKKMTTEFGMIQFSKISQPDLDSGYTLDDNARALIAITMHYELTGDEEDLNYIRIYLDFIKYCLQPGKYFLNYVDEKRKFTKQNETTNLADANGRALWALGYLVSQHAILPAALTEDAEEIIEAARARVEMIHSTRAMAFVIKGFYYYNQLKKSPANTALIKKLANRLVQMYRHESERHWQWYEGYLTYANSVLPEAMLCAWQETGDPVYREIAKSSFDFLLSLTFTESGIKVISNKSWLQKGQKAAHYGEQPIDVAYTIQALDRFFNEFGEEGYLEKMIAAFSWFLGNNHLNQIIYNPCTGGCYDGLEESRVNLNQGAESTLSYLMARLSLDQYMEVGHGKTLAKKANLVRMCE
ncbi:MAG: glycosyltransferase [Saprospirales bacterium]|nr:glycosyltransferase [Saprospirales bacterium]